MAEQPQKAEHNKRPPVLAGLALAVCFLAGLGTGALLWRGEPDAERTAVDTKQQAEMVSKGYEAAGLLLVAADNFAQERGLTYAALKGSGHIPEEFRNDIVQARDAADKALSQALNIASSDLAFRRDSSFMRKVAKDQESLNEMRTMVDGWSGSDDPAENSKRANEWFATSSRLLTTDEQLLELVHARIRSVGVDIDTSVALKLQRLAIIMLDFVGRERGVMSGAIVEKRPLDDSFSSWILPAYRGRINGIWRSIKAAADSNALSPEITALIAKVEQDYFGDMEKLRESIIKASKAGKPYPVSADEWFAKASAVIDSIVGLGQEAGQFARSKSEKA